MVTGEEQQIEPDLTEEAVQAAGDQEVPDPLEEKTMVMTSEDVILLLHIFTWSVRIWKISHDSWQELQLFLD